MSMTVQLPPSLEGRLAAAARRVRLLRGLRGLSWLVVALVVPAALAVGADWVMGGLSPAWRGVNLAAWLLLGAGVVFLGLVRPLRRKLDPADLAAAIEQKHPELGERLSSSVELARHSDEGSGRP